MPTLIALFRGINVGGKNVLPMKGLVSVFNKLGVNKLETYIQSGNVVFQSSGDDNDKLARRLAEEIERRFGFLPQVLLVPAKRLGQIVDGNPFSAALADPKTLHVFFLTENPPDPDFATLDNYKSATEQYHLADRAFYLCAPDGIGRSKLAGRVEKILGVPTTARNWRSVARINEIAGRFD